MMIIHFKQSKFRKILDILLTIFGWIFLTFFLYYFIIHVDGSLNFKFYLLNLSNANGIILFTFFITVVSAVSLCWWSAYNKRKYGSLNRRKFPRDANNKEIAEYFQLTVEEVTRIQNDKYIEMK